MSLSQFAICVRVCAQIPDKDIVGDMPRPKMADPLTMELRVSVIDVYTPVLIQDMKATMKSNKKAAEDQKNRQVMRERRMQKVAAEKVAKEEMKAAVRAEVEAEEKRVAAEKKAEWEAVAAEQWRRSREGTDRDARARLAAGAAC